jgi:hypothetical protein
MNTDYQGKHTLFTCASEHSSVRAQTHTQVDQWVDPIVARLAGEDETSQHILVLDTYRDRRPHQLEGDARPMNPSRPERIACH